jgi:hypothetical protein
MKKLYIEVADTYSKKEKGLMYRKQMAKDEGMLFKFAYPNRLSFWMQNTYIPLDIAFLDDNGKILQIEEMIPLSTRPISSNEHCRYALEVNRGWFKENKIHVGNYIDGINHQKKTAAIGMGNGNSPIGNPAAIQNPENPQQQPQQPAAQVIPKGNPIPVTPENIRKVLETAKNEGADVQIVYKGVPHLISPRKALEFQKGISEINKEKSDAEASVPNAIANVWDSGIGGGHEKSFTIDYITAIKNKNGEEILLDNQGKIILEKK